MEKNILQFTKENLECQFSKKNGNRWNIKIQEKIQHGELELTFSQI